MDSTIREFKKKILQGIPDVQLPKLKPLDSTINHAPRRKDILSKEEKKLAVRNALRYFPKKYHAVLAREFAKELQQSGRIYMYRFRPDYKISARSINDFPHKSVHAAAIMLMLSNNLDDAVAQHPHELITYGGNGAVFQNWAQYLLAMKYLAEMTDEQTLVLYSGHPLGLFPSHKNAPRLVVTNGMMVPNYSKPDDWEKFNALGVTQYGQMTAGSFMYIGPQGIVHGTTITLINAARLKGIHSIGGNVFVSSGLGGMSGAQGKAAVIAGAIGVIAEINPKAVEKRYLQGWVQEVYGDLPRLIKRIQKAVREKEPVSLAYSGNIIDLWEAFVKEDVDIALGSDQTSLHNPFAGGYYPAGMDFNAANAMMVNRPAEFKKRVYASLRRQVNAINSMSKRGMYFWDYGNAFLLEAGRAGANVLKDDGMYIYPSYVQDIMGPLCFDFGFGPFRWVCTSSDPKDLALTDMIAVQELKRMRKTAPKAIQQQLQDNIQWIKAAGKNNLVVGSQARILYADGEGRTRIAVAFNRAIRQGRIHAPIVIGRDHHDTSSADSPYRETSNIYDGSQYTADMAMQNVIGDSFRGATWVSIHNGGGVGWGEAVSSGFGLLLDGSKEADKRIESMLFWDVNNGIARRSWARNANAIFTAKRVMKNKKSLRVTLPELVNEKILKELF
ncbi:MAG: urocanate hydratase [Candidatus Levybacteria bacterium]|nr:urocanate hydratase [Candidatus Levybacteria bacterium]